MTDSSGAILIGGLRGSSGKTAVTVGLAAVWQQQGHNVVPFKKGPDYVDAAWLSLVAGSPCYSLDTYLLGQEATRQSFLKRAKQGSIALIEGNRGLFDGMDEVGSHSTAELAKLLNVPVVVVVDCTKATRTVAAMVLGLSALDPDVSIRGVILNRVGGARHERIIRQCIEAECDLPVLGAIPRQERFSFPERHLGLVPPDEHPFAESTARITAKTISGCLDTGRIFKLAAEWNPWQAHAGDIFEEEKAYFANLSRPVRIGVFRDSAFQFYYPENLEALSQRGAELVYISPLSDEELPQLDALYIGGGFPETHGQVLADNVSFKESLGQAIESGLPVYAECGGLMYLGRSIEYKGRVFPMAGVLPLKFGFSSRPKWHGYTDVEVIQANPFFKTGQTLRGHEFHYSYVDEWGQDTHLECCFKLKRGHGLNGRLDGISYKGVVASYTHVHALGTPSWTEGIMRAASYYAKWGLNMTPGHQEQLEWARGASSGLNELPP